MERSRSYYHLDKRGHGKDSCSAAETVRFLDKHKVQKMQVDRFPTPIKRNVVDSDGTLIISHGPLTGKSKYSENIDLNHHKPIILINLDEIDFSEASKMVNDWIIREEIQILNVTGPRAAKDPNIYQDTMELLMKVLSMIKSI